MANTKLTDEDREKDAILVIKAMIVEELGRCQDFGLLDLVWRLMVRGTRA